MGGDVDHCCDCKAKTESGNQYGIRVIVEGEIRPGVEGSRLRVEYVDFEMGNDGCTELYR